MRPFLVAIAFVFVCTPTIARAADVPPDLDAIVANGQRTQAKFATATASWDVVVSPANMPGSTMNVSIVHSPTMSRVIFSLSQHGQTAEVMRMIIRDGFWYVTENDHRGKYRPREAPFFLTSTGLYLALAEPHFPGPDSKFGAFVKQADGVADYRDPLNPTLVAQVQGILDEIKRAGGQSPQYVREQTDNLREMLSQGLKTRIDVNSGLIVESDTPEMKTRIDHFQFLSENPDYLFAIDPAKQWEDFSDDPTTIGDRNDLLILAHSSVWRRGNPAGNVDAMLVDLQTGRYRRVPFGGAVSTAGCFSQDRTRAYVAGTVPLSNTMLSPYEVNLSTGETRPLGGEALALGLTIVQSLSPDGKTLALLHKDLSAKQLLAFQVCLVDLPTNRVRTLGEPIDTAFISWLPDSSALVLVVRTPGKNLEDEPAQSICRMSLQTGAITPIIAGRDPLVLADQKRILYKDPATEQWMTCDFDGKDAKLFEDGLTKHAFPALSPDGKRLAMARITPEGPQPVIIDIDTGKETPVFTQLPPGLWTTPTWR